MEQRTYHGQITPQQVGEALLARFNHGNLRAQLFGDKDRVIVQIATRTRPTSGGRAALSVTIRRIENEDGITVKIGKQDWLGVAASLGTTAFSAIRNPWSLLNRLDDIAQDFEYLQLAEKTWEAIAETARSAGAAQELSERLRRTMCEYCYTANQIGAPSCISCGAPLGRVQPQTCQNCGYVVKEDEMVCPNCKKRL
jgi:predicted Zn-ribbon and HTH transcriptional regulator